MDVEDGNVIRKVAKPTSASKTQNGYIHEPTGMPMSTFADRIRNCKPQSVSIPLSEKNVTHLETAAAKFIQLYRKEAAEPVELRRISLETTIRKVFWSELKSTDVFLTTEWIIRFAIACSESDLIDAAVPFIIFHEACDWGSSAEKEQIANLFVDMKDKWKLPKFSTPLGCKNMLMRFSTELLTGLSKTTSARARGRLLCFVSARIPISDKGAANILGDFNLGKSPTTEGSTTGLASNLHEFDKFKHLCNLLDYLRNPSLIFAENGFAGFKTAFESVIELMTPAELNGVDHEEGEHVEDAGRSGASTKDSTSSPRQTVTCRRFIPEPTQAVLTDDLKDDRVKRNILCRFLLVTQYIAMPSKPKGVFEPSIEQLTWCDQMVQTTLTLLSKTSPRGPAFVERLVDHLESEAGMSIWKDNGCPSLETKPAVDLSTIPSHPLPDQLPYPRILRKNKAGKDANLKRKPIKDMSMFGPKRFFGSMEATKVFTKGPNTMDEYQNLGYQPPPLDIFAKVIEENIAGVKAKAINEEKFQWRALRILGKRTHIHFSNETEKIPTKDIGSFLENYIMQLADKVPVLQTAKAKALSEQALNLTSTADELMQVDDLEALPKVAEDDLMEHGSGAMDEELLGPGSPGQDHLAETTMEKESPGGSKEFVQKIAAQICPEWEKFGALLKFGPDEMDYWKTAFSEPVQQAATMLQVWTDSQDDANTAVQTLITLLGHHYT